MGSALVFFALLYLLEENENSISVDAMPSIKKISDRSDAVKARCPRSSTSKYFMASLVILNASLNKPSTNSVQLSAVISKPRSCTG